MNTEVISLILGGIGTVVSVTTIILVLTKGALTTEKRLTKLETKMENEAQELRQALLAVLLEKK